jgi:predicted DCC family thiol-disulfide oxidoreductase YuxK
MTNFVLLVAGGFKVVSLLSPRTDRRGELLVLYDGKCVLCNSSVDFLLRRDTAEIFYFAQLQGETGRRVLKRHGKDPENLDSIVYVRGYDTADETIYEKSTAVLQALNDLGGIWKLLSYLKIIPRPIRDYIYETIAANRYTWFGQYDECRIPDSAANDRFLE